MKVQETPPYVPQTLDVLSPDDVNIGFAYAFEAFNDVASRRAQTSVIVLPFVKDLVTGYTQAATAEELTFRLTPPATVVVERAFLSANLTSSASVTVSVTTAAGATPDGATTPLLSTMGAISDATLDVDDLAVESFTLVAGTTYLFTVATAVAATFTTERFDVILHLRTDRWLNAGSSTLPIITAPGLSDASPRDPTVLTALDAAYTVAAQALATHVVAPAPAGPFLVPALSSATPLANRQFFLPRFDSARAKCRVIRLRLYVVPTSVGSSTTITATLQDETGTPTAVSASVTYVASSTTQAGDSGVVSLSIDIATPGISGFEVGDYRVVLSSNNATACKKAYAYLWLSR